MRKFCVLLLALSACTGQLTGPTGRSATAQPLDLDGGDNQPELQAAIDALCAQGGGSLVLPAGTFSVRRPASLPGTADNWNSSLLVHCDNIELSGAGYDQTTLLFEGDGFGADWAGVKVHGASYVSVHDMTLRASWFNTDEQSHLLVLQGPVAQVNVYNMHFNHPVVDAVEGDCLRLLGDPDDLVQFVNVQDSEFEACDRAGVSVQEGVQDVTMSGLVLSGIGKTAIDMEPTGSGSISRFVMDNITVNGGGISLGGNSGNFATDLELWDSTVVGRVGVNYADGVLLVYDTITADVTDGGGALNIMASSDIFALHDSVTRTAGATYANAIRLLGHNGLYSDSNLIYGGSATNLGTGDGVFVQSATNTTVEDTAVSVTGSTYSGAVVVATGQNSDGTAFTENTFTGGHYSVQLAGSPLYVTRTAISGNSGYGLQCVNPAKVTGTTLSGNSFSHSPSGCTGL